MEKTISIYSRQHVQKSTNQKFFKFSYTKDGKEFFEIKFKSDLVKPNQSGYWKLTFEPTGDYVSSPQKAKSEKGNKIIWVRKYIKLEKDIEKDEERAQKQLAELEDLF